MATGKLTFTFSNVLSAGRSVSATAINRSPGAMYAEVRNSPQEPLIITKAGMPEVVVLSYDHYIQLRQAASMVEDFDLKEK